MLSIVGAGCRYAICLVVVASFQATAIAAPTPPDTAAVVSGPLTLDRALTLAAYISTNRTFRLSY